MLNYTPYNRVDTYTNLLNTLSRLEKVELIKKIAESLKEDTIDTEKMERYHPRILFYFKRFL